MEKIEETEGAKFDPRVYLAMFVFRWKIILLCVLLCLLGGVAYLKFTPSKYLTRCVVMLWRDPQLALTDTASQWSSTRAYIWILASQELQDTVIRQLEPAYAQKLGGRQNMKLDVAVGVERGHGSMLNISVKSGNPEYAEKYLNSLWDAFQEKQKTLKMDSSGTASRILQDEIKSLEDSIEEAEDDLIDYARLNAIDVTSYKASMESKYLMSLLNYRTQLGTELTLLDTQFPILQNEDATVIQDADALVRKAGSVGAVDGSDTEGSPEASVPGKEEASGKASFSSAVPERAMADSPEVKSWANMKVELMRIQVREKDLLTKLTEDHPEVKAVRKQMDELKDKLKISQEVAFGRLKDRHKALKIAYQALEGPIRDWKNTYQSAAQKQAGYRRKSLVVERREGLYKTLYSRLQDLKISDEVKADHFSMVQPVRTDGNPVWPNAMKVMSAALFLALGSGFGLAILVHFFDNKMQTILDVEVGLGMPFLGGIPRWVGPGEADERVAHPIVLEEHASGVLEAYRVLRTNVLTSLDKAGQKVMLFTSAEPREGKTITCLNLAVMIAKTGKQVLLMDMDLRRPRLHRSLGKERSPGITDVLAGTKTFQDIIVQTDIPNLSFAPSGDSADNVAELLQSANLSSFFAGVRQMYDYVLIDTSPVLRAADVSIIVTRGLCSIVYVIRVNGTPKPLIRYALDQLKNGHFLGVVMNHIDLSKISSIYYSYQYPNQAYYAYAYAYGYDYDHYADGVKTRGAKRRWYMPASIRSLARRVRRAMLPTE